MKKLFKNQRGFSHHFLLPVFVVVAVTGIGTYVLQRSRAAVNVYDDAKTSLVKKQEDPKRGLIYTGLRAVKKGANHPCAGLFEVQRKNPKDPIRCTHGPDPAPTGVDLTNHAAINQKVNAEFAKTEKDANSKPVVDEKAIKSSPTQNDITATTAAANWDDQTIFDIAYSSRLTNKCVGDGSSGPRVYMVYAHTSDENYYSKVKPVMLQLTQAMQATYAGNSLNAAPAGQAARVLRFYHYSDCTPVIHNLQIPYNYYQDFSTVETYMNSIGMNRSDRKYVVWLEGQSNECGRGTVILDTSPNIFKNRNNLEGGLAVIGKGCWSLSATLHELQHNLGAVQSTAPHYDGDSHCYQQQDIQCNDYYHYQLSTCASDNITVGLLHVYNLDCGDDDYWAANVNGKLKGQWNTFTSAWLTTSYR